MHRFAVKWQLKIEPAMRQLNSKLEVEHDDDKANMLP
jgi:hypothetical protein